MLAFTASLLLLPARGGSTFNKATTTKSTSPSTGFTQGTEVQPFTSLKPGDYTWMPQVSPTGPVVIIVSLQEQVMFIYRNGVRIGRCTVSSGKSGHRTPTGVFTILQKKEEHYSSIYKGASMPHMQRLTWDGIAMHAGNLPGYPASHGCVRLPADFAQKLFTVTKCGTTVVITDGSTKSDYTASPGLLLSTAKKASPRPAVANGEFIWNPDKSPSGPVSIMISSVDREAYVYRNGVEIGRAGLGDRSGKDFGNHAYAALAATDSEGHPEWEALGSLDRSGTPDMQDVRKYLDIPAGFLAQAHGIVTPGTTLILTNQPVNGTTRSGTGFDIMTASN